MVDYFFDKALLAAPNDYELSAIMNEMERRYNIPALKINLTNWKTKTKNAEDILAAYRKISNMRNI